MAFEQLVLTNLIHNEQYTRKVLPFLKTDYFKSSGEQELYKHISAFVSKYNCPPTKEAIAIQLSNAPLGEGTFNEAMEVIKTLEPDNNHIEWLFDETEKWVQESELFIALNKSIEISEGNHKDLDKSAIPSILMDALGVCFDTNVGHDYFESAEAHWQEMHSDETKFPFTIGIFNKVTKGGVPKKTLNIVAAPINCGKSVHLIQQCADWLAGGKNVLYISMEMSETMVRERVDVVLMDMTFDAVKALEKQPYLNRINELRKKTMGRLIVKEYPSGGAHVGHFRHLLQELKIKKNFVPDMIAIDYLTICASSKLPASARGNTNTYFTSVAEELRGFAAENDIPLWTAVQLDRASQGASDAGMSNVGLAIGISATADFMFVILAPDELRERMQMIGKVIKNRYSSHKGTKFLIGMNPDRQKFYDVDDTEQAVVMSEDELKEMNMPNSIPNGRKSVDTSQLASWSF